MIKREERIIFFLFLIITLNKCIQPPNEELLSQISSIPKLSEIFNNNDLPLKDSENQNKSIINSTATITYYEDYQTLDHQIIVVPQNILENECFEGFIFNAYDFYKYINNITTKCEIIRNNLNKICRTIFDKNNGTITISVYGNICKGDKIIINYKYDTLIYSKEPLLKTDIITIPLLTNLPNPLFCSYKYIIPEGYFFLGTKINYSILKKESETTYSYYGSCEKLNADLFRFSPEIVSWKADIIMSLVFPPRFTDDVKLQLPLSFLGGKYTDFNYYVFDLEGRNYHNVIEADFDYETGNFLNVYFTENILDEIYVITLQVPAINKEEVGVEIKSTFTNKLTNNFKIYDCINLKEINLSAIDQEIIDKANEIIKEKSDEPDYYKIGKFVNKYLTYDKSPGIRITKTLKEIYNSKKGKSLEYTLLYNAMLNSIGIKTLIINGWFVSSENLDDKKIHYWTAALINGKWKELDATYDFFEGVSAGHILSTFSQNSVIELFLYSVLGKEKDEISYNNVNIKRFIDIIEINPKSSNLLLIIIIIAVVIVWLIFIICNRSSTGNYRR